MFCISHKGGLIQMTIAEQQKTFNMFTEMVNIPNGEPATITQPNPAASVLLPLNSITPVFDSGLGQGHHKQTMDNKELINSANPQNKQTTKAIMKMGYEVSQMATGIANQALDDEIVEDVSYEKNS